MQACFFECFRGNQVFTIVNKGLYFMRWQDKKLLSQASRFGLEDCTSVTCDPNLLLSSHSLPLVVYTFIRFKALYLYS